MGPCFCGFGCRIVPGGVGRGCFSDERHLCSVTEVLPGSQLRIPFALQELESVYGGLLRRQDLSVSP